MSEEWPDDDPRFTGPGCRLDKAGGVASGEFTKPQRYARRYYAVCELVQEVMYGNVSGARIVNSGGRVVIVEEFEDQGTAELAARKHAVKIVDRMNELTVCTVTVMPVWRVK